MGSVGRRTFIFCYQEDYVFAHHRFFFCTVSNIGNVKLLYNGYTSCNSQSIIGHTWSGQSFQSNKHIFFDVSCLGIATTYTMVGMVGSWPGEDLPIAVWDYWAQWEKSNLPMNALICCGIITRFFLLQSQPNFLIYVWVKLKSSTICTPKICRGNSDLLHLFNSVFLLFFTLTQFFLVRKHGLPTGSGSR